jgi:hypothetical protein
MLKKLISLLLFIPILINAQEEINDTIALNSNNNISGMYVKNNSSMFNLTYSGDNSLTGKKLTFNTTTTYSLNYSEKITANEWQQKTNLTYKNVFALHMFNTSLIRKISNDNSFGIGIGKWWKYGSITYATLYQKTNYADKINDEVLRHSIRVKIKYEHKKFIISSEYYYQPNVNNLNDNILYGIIKLSLFPNNKINFTVLNNLNYRSLSNVKLINTITLGVGFKLKN